MLGRTTYGPNLLIWRRFGDASGNFWLPNLLTPEQKDNCVSTLMIMYLCGGGLLAILSIFLILKMIPPNGLYGFRIKKTMENPELWYPVNAYSGKWLLATGLCEILSAVGFRSIPGMSADVYALSVLAVFVVILGIGLVASVRYLNSL